MRIELNRYQKLKAYFLGIAVHRSVENRLQEFQKLDFEPYAPVKGQLFSILRAANRARETADFELVPTASR